MMQRMIWVKAIPYNCTTACFVYEGEDIAFRTHDASRVEYACTASSNLHGRPQQRKMNPISYYQLGMNRAVPLLHTDMLLSPKVVLSAPCSSGSIWDKGHQ